ncbi:MAG: hypothetical protein ACK56F_29185, partial [bacterium]
MPSNQRQEATTRHVKSQNQLHRTLDANTPEFSQYRGDLFQFVCRTGNPLQPTESSLFTQKTGNLLPHRQNRGTRLTVNRLKCGTNSHSQVMQCT